MYPLPWGSSAELHAALYAHGLDSRQGLHPHAHGADQVAAGLEGLLHGDARPHQGGPGVPHQVNQALEGRAVGQEVVDDQHPVLRQQKLLGHDDVVHPAVGEGLHLGGVHVPGDVFGLVLLGEDHRAIKKLRSHARDPDPRCLDGQNLGNSAVSKQAQELPAHVLKQFYIHLVVEKAVHLQHAALPDLSVGADALLQLLHAISPLWRPPGRSDHKNILLVYSTIKLPSRH